MGLSRGGFLRLGANSEMFFKVFLRKGIQEEKNSDLKRFRYHAYWPRSSTCVGLDTVLWFGFITAAVKLSLSCKLAGLGTMNM